MPLKPFQVLQILQAKQADFGAFDAQSWQLLHKYEAALAEFSRLSEQELTQRLPGSQSVGARPLEPLGSWPNWVMPSNLIWQNRESSLEWVRERLAGVATFAVDGSQIFPSKDVSIPVALVQIGWFENPHLPMGTYNKDVLLDVMTPAELQGSDRTMPVERRVNMRRFQMEIERLIQYMEDNSRCQECLVFLDGSLIATFAEAFDAEGRAFYVDCLLRLLRTSEQQRVPLVAYIDTSYARDLTRTLQHLANLPEALALHDAQLLNRSMQWGDRTPLFICDRPGEAHQRAILADYQEQAQRIGFTYLKTHDGYPARLEVPIWVAQAGLLERVIDWVRGEVIIGSGYPYVIETADQVAVLQAEDRQTFFRLLQEWAEQADLKLRFSRKWLSKLYRRR